MRYFLHIGEHQIDLFDPRPEQIDVEAIENRLRVMKRWSNNPAALTVHEHRHLVRLMMIERNEAEGLVWWGEHHDDHEAIIGDIPGPVKHLIAEETSILDRVEDGLDRAICAAHGRTYPSRSARKDLVHLYDKAAETVEWLFVLGQDPQPWNAELPPDIPTTRLQELLAEARWLG